MRRSQRHQKKSKIPRFLFILLVLFLLVSEHSFYSASRTSVASNKTEQKKKPAKKADNFEKLAVKTVEPTDDYSKEIEQQLIDNKFSGTALVYHKGKMILHKGYGWQSSKSQIKNTVTTEYGIGSIQKGPTAYLVLKALQNNKLKLTDTLNKFYPEIPNSENISIKDMLNMCSGLQGRVSTVIPDALKTQEILAEEIQQITADPQKNYAYFSINYNLLSGILEKITQKNYYTLVHDELIQPMKLKNTSFEHDDKESQAYSYRSVNGTETPNVGSKASYAGELGTGNLFMSAGDLFLYEQNLLNPAYVSDTWRKDFWAPYEGEKYASGVYMEKEYFHSRGVKAGFEANINSSYDGKNVLILLSNVHVDDQYFNKLTDEIYFKMIGKQ